VLVLMIFGLASLTAYWLHALRRPDPLFSPTLFRVGSLRIGLLGNLFSRLGSSCMPFLIPLLLQVTMGYSPAQAGMMMLPVAIASMSMKKLTTPLITRHGYRRVLVVNTLLVGLTMASFAFASPEQPLTLRIAQLAVFGAVNSLQFTAMNTLTLKDLSPATASSGNSLLSMVQMLAMGMGVAAAGAVLAAFTAFFGGEGVQTLAAFRATFATMALITIASAGIFWQLDARDSAAAAAGREQDVEVG
jgi:MFS family permease